MSAVLEVENLSVRIPIAAGLLHPVRGVSFHVNQGETLAIVGESGCGKSLTSLAVMGLLPAAARRQADRLSFQGEDIRSYSERRMGDIRGNRMSMIFQDPMTSLNPTYTIGNQLVEVMLRHRRVSRAQARDRAVQLLERVGITAAASRLKQYPHQLSGGLRQRGDDRDGPDVRSGTPDRRRADHSARRDDPGADSPAHRAVAEGIEHRGHPDHARPWAWSPG